MGLLNNAVPFTLFVLAQVMSRATPGVAVVDCGHKGVSVDSGMPGVWQRPGAPLSSFGGSVPILCE